MKTVEQIISAAQNQLFIFMYDNIRFIKERPWWIVMLDNGRPVGVVPNDSRAKDEDEKKEIFRRALYLYEHYENIFVDMDWSLEDLV